MKQIGLMFTSFVLVAAVSLATYNDSLNGAQTAAPEAEGIALNLTATGDLPGMSKLKLQRSGQNVSGGSFQMTVLPQNADATSTERGELIGTVSGGTLTLTAEGTLASASGVQVTIQSGTKEFTAVTAGSGTISITASAENPSQLNGTLVLNF